MNLVILGDMKKSDPLYPKPSSKSVTNVMKGNKRANTKPELMIRSILHKRGFRFRKDHLIKLDSWKCKPDIVFIKRKLAIFIDGCFWHKCPIHWHMPKKNVDYWEKKFNRNLKRDKNDKRYLNEAGWKVFRIWEHVPIEDAINQIINKIQKIDQMNKEF